jgi:hypothetical protein
MANDRRVGVAGVLVGVFILACVTVLGFIVFRPARPKSEPAPQLYVPIERANNVKCVVQLNKINATIQMYGAENGKYPDRLQDLTDLSPSDLNCPVSNRVYKYDPATGRATCPGHD